MEKFGLLFVVIGMTTLLLCHNGVSSPRRVCPVLALLARAFFLSLHAGVDFFDVLTQPSVSRKPPGVFLAVWLWLCIVGGLPDFIIATRSLCTPNKWHFSHLFAYPFLVIFVG